VPRRKISFSVFLSIAGVAVVSYVLGAAAMFFQLPSSEFLDRALVGARAWYVGRQPAARPPATSETTPVSRADIDRPGETFDGFTLYACLGRKQLRTQAMLINMRGDVVFRWAIPFSHVWPTPSHLTTRPSDSLVCFEACHLYPNGDLLVVFHGQTFPIGCGLARLDKDSKVLWAYPAAIHHDVDVAEDGTIFTIEQAIESDLPNGIPPGEVDYLLHLSPEGKLLRNPISILGALENSPYAELVETLRVPNQRHVPPPGSTAPPIDYQFMVGDPLHTNSVKALHRNWAANFPLFKPGHVLISIRDMSVLAVIDPESGSIVWAARGPWYAQHDAQFLSNGHLLFYDNLGVASGSRVLEYDPQTQAFPWSFAGASGAPLYSSERGLCQRLPNGNTLIVNSEGGEMIEVTHDKKIVWSSYVDGYITTARRYAPDQVRFLDAGQRARP
jgi:hypothetical protein